MSRMTCSLNRMVCVFMAGVKLLEQGEFLEQRAERLSRLERWQLLPRIMLLILLFDPKHCQRGRCDLLSASSLRCCFHHGMLSPFSHGLWPATYVVLGAR